MIPRLLALTVLLVAAAPASQPLGAGWAPLGGDIALGSVRALVLADDGTLYAGQADPAGVWASNGAAWGRLGNGADGSIYAVALAPDAAMPGDERVYAGGGLFNYEGFVAWSMAVWDGAAWGPVGGGVRRWNGQTSQTTEVYALVVSGDGRLYVGGEFNWAGTTTTGVAAGAVAVWDGSSWSAVGGAGLAQADGERANVRALAFGPDGRLYAGGEFTTADGQPVANVAAWDGTAWDDLGGGLPSEFGIYTLAFGPDGRLYVGGSIGVVGGVETDLAAWDGTAWAPVGPDIDGGSFLSAGVYTLAFSPDGKLYAGGFFTLPDGSRHVARLDGYLAGPGAGTWACLDGGVFFSAGQGRVSALTVSPEGEVYVGGLFDRVGPPGAPVEASNVAVWLGDRVVGAEDEPDAGALALSVSPNPSHGASTVSVTLGGASPVRVVVVDALGRTVAVVHDGPLGAGRHRLSLPPSLAPGVYAVTGAGASARWVVAR